MLIADMLTLAPTVMTRMTVFLPPCSLHVSLPVLVFITVQRCRTVESTWERGFSNKDSVSEDGGNLQHIGIKCGTCIVALGISNSLYAELPSLLCLPRSHGASATPWTNPGYDSSLDTPTTYSIYGLYGMLISSRCLPLAYRKVFQTRDISR